MDNVVEFALVFDCTRAKAPLQKRLGTLHALCESSTLRRAEPSTPPLHIYCFADA